MRHLLTLILTVISVSLTTGSFKASAQEASKKAKKIGVISLLRDEFHSVYVGTTVFQNKTNYRKTPEWKFSSFSEDLLIREIKKSKLHSAGKARYNKASLLKINLEAMGAFSSSEPYLNELNTIGRKQGFDQLVVISPVTLDHPMFNFNGIGEYGHFHLYAPILSDHLCTFVKYRMAIYDVAQNEIIDKRFTTTTRYGMGNSACSDKPIGGVPTMLPEDFIYRDNVSAFPASQMNRIKGVIKTHLATLLQNDIECLKLAPLKNGQYREDGCGIFD